MNVFVFYVLLTTRWDKVGKLKCKIFWFTSSWIVWWLQAEKFLLQDVYFYTNKLQKIFSSCNRFLHVMIPCVAMLMDMAKGSELWVWHVGGNMHFLGVFDCQIGMKSPMLSHANNLFPYIIWMGRPSVTILKRGATKTPNVEHMSFAIFANAELDALLIKKAIWLHKINGNWLWFGLWLLRGRYFWCHNLC